MPAKLELDPAYIHDRSAFKDLRIIGRIIGKLIGVEDPYWIPSSSLKVNFEMRSRITLQDPATSMAKTEPKTRPTTASVKDHIDALPTEQQRVDSRALVQLMQAITKAAPVMWGPSIIGFGSTHLTYASGRQLDWPIIGFSPRKTNLSIYLTCDIKQYQPLLDQLGKHTTGVGCLYVKRLADVDSKVLEKLVKVAVKEGV